MLAVNLLFAALASLDLVIRLNRNQSTIDANCTEMNVIVTSRLRYARLVTGNSRAQRIAAGFTS